MTLCTPPAVWISAGASHCVALEVETSIRNGDADANENDESENARGEKTSTLYSWGSSEEGQLGHRDSEDHYYPKEVEALQAVALSAVCCGANHTLAVADSKELYTWGWGDFGRLGLGDPSDRRIPTPVTALSGVRVCHVACGDSHCLVVAQEGRLFTFGRNQNGQLGLGDTQDRLVPSPVASLWDDGVRVRRVAGGAEHSCITAEGGHMYTFGWGSYGNLGHGHVSDLHVPTKVMALEGHNVTDPICGWRHSAALTDRGRLWTFGWSKYGQLGHGNNEDVWTPKLLPEFAGGPITAAAGGWRHMCALSGSSGTLYSWGWNQFGQLGVGSTEDANSPQQVTVGAGHGEHVSAVSCGWRHTLAVAGEDAGVYTWGRCTNGQLGHGDTTQRNVPMKVEAMDLMRQGIGVGVCMDQTGEGRNGDGAAGGGSGAGVASGVFVTKRSRPGQDLMEVPTNKKLHPDPEDDFAAVPDSDDS